MFLVIDVLNSAGQPLLADETKQYLDSHPELAKRLQRAEKVYRLFSEYLNLTQSRIVVRESGASNVEADLSATVLRTSL